jgi:hypothetical protein
MGKMAGNSKVGKPNESKVTATPSKSEVASRATPGLGTAKRQCTSIAPACSGIYILPLSMMQLHSLRYLAVCQVADCEVLHVPQTPIVKNTKTGAPKTSRAKSAYLFFQEDKRPALKGPVRSLAAFSYSLRVASNFGMPRRNDLPCPLMSDSLSVTLCHESVALLPLRTSGPCQVKASTPVNRCLLTRMLDHCRSGAGPGHGRHVEEAGRAVEDNLRRRQGAIPGAL